MGRPDDDDRSLWEDTHDDESLPSRIIRVLHSRSLNGPGVPFEVMPGWANAIRDRAKREPSQGFSITMAELRRLAEAYPEHFSRYIRASD